LDIKGAIVQIKSQLLAYEEKLRDAVKLVPLASDNWAANVPKEAGVYVIWKGVLPVYVGETSSLRLRMRDLRRPINHSFTKKVSTSFRIAENETHKIAKAIKSTYTLSYVEVRFGRAELEEYLILRWRRSLINKPAKRLLHSPQYGWVGKV
jgi:hypothetical protein